MQFDYLYNRIPTFRLRIPNMGGYYRCSVPPLGLITIIAYRNPGLLVFSTACGMQSVLRSIITNSILPSEVSIVYSVFNILHLLSGSLAGPLYSGTFTAGMNIGGFWLGLPFVMSGALAILALGGMAFLREKRSYDLLADDDSDA